MDFRISLKLGSTVLVDAETFVVENEVYLFSTAAAGLVASFPVSNVLSVVKQKQ